jgi:hypothetical protein
VPVLGTTAYATAEDVLTRLRVIVNDSEVQGGDILTDTAPLTFPLLNGAFERVQLELAKVGVEVSTAEAWLVGLPIMPIVDPEGRMVIDDSGTNIFYPSGVGNVFANHPQLPTNLVLPLNLYERPSGTANRPSPMKQPAGGILTIEQQLFLGDWEWKSDGIRTRGAMQSIDVKIFYEKSLPVLSGPTDPVPIRGVVNAAAYFGAVIFTEARGGAIAPSFKANAMEEIFLLQQISARRRQKKQIRRRPYSGRGGRQYPNL